MKCFRVFDEDGSGTIDFEEFIMIVNFKNSSTYEDKLGIDISAIGYFNTDTILQNGSSKYLTRMGEEQSTWMN